MNMSNGLSRFIGVISHIQAMDTENKVDVYVAASVKVNLEFRSNIEGNRNGVSLWIESDESNCKMLMRERYSGKNGDVQIVTNPLDAAKAIYEYLSK